MEVEGYLKANPCANYANILSDDEARANNLNKCKERKNDLTCANGEAKTHY